MLGWLLDAWPTRRRLAAALLLPVVAASFVVGADSAGAGPSAGWYALVAVAAALGAAVLATYVPVVGHRLDLGCTPCAAMSAFTVVAAALLLRGYGAEPTGPLLASAVLLFGLTQRMSQPASCTNR